MKVGFFGHSSETIVELAPVSGIQLINRPAKGECAGPSERGISEVGLLQLLLLNDATLVQAWPGAPSARGGFKVLFGGPGAEDVRDKVSELG